MKRQNKFRSILVAASAAAMLAACSSPEQRVERYYESGVKFLEEGDLGRANVQFQNVLKIDDRHAPTRIALARIAEERKDFQSMFGQLQQVVRLDPNNLESMSKLGKLYLVGGEETEAMDLAERALAIDPNYIDARTLKAALLLRVGDKAGAVEIAEAVRAEAPGNAEAATVIATAMASDDDVVGALAELDRVLAVEPKHAVLQLLRIRLLSEQDREDDVMAGLKNLTTLFSEEPAYFRTYALALIEKERLDEAVAILKEVVTLRPDDLDAKLDVVRLVRRTQGDAGAERQLREFIAAAPEDSEVRFALVDFLVQQGEVDRAMEELQPIAQGPDENLARAARNRIATIYLRRGDRDAAEKIVSEILEEDPRNNAALLRRAQIQILDDDVDAAIANLRTVSNNDPDSFEAMMLMAGALESQGNRDLARAELAKAFDASERNPRVTNLFAKFLLSEQNVDRAEEVLEQSLARNGNNAENLQLLAQARLRKQDWRGAEEVAAILDNLEDDDAALRIRSVALTGLEEYEQIIELLGDRQDDAPLATTPLAILIQAFLAENRFDEARETLAGVIQSDPKNYPARILMAQTYNAEGDVANLERALLEAAETAPQRADAYSQLYILYTKQNETAKAAAIVDRGIANAPDSDALKIYKADVLLSSGDDRAALALYDDLIERIPNNKIVVNNYISLSNSLRADAQTAQAMLAHVDTIADEENPYFQDTVGWTYFLAGQTERALTYLEKAAAGAPDNAEILYHYGAAKIEAGRVDEGKETLRQALERGGETFALAGDTRALLAQH